MLHPSYQELVEIVNSTRSEGEPVIENRYSLAIIAAKRARQISEMTTLLGNYAQAKGVWADSRRATNEAFEEDLKAVYREVFHAEPYDTLLATGEKRSLSMAIRELSRGEVHMKNTDIE